MGHGQGHGHDGERQWPDHDQKGPSLRLWENLVGRSVGRPVGRSVVPGWRRRAEARGRRRRRRRQQLNTHQVQDRRTAESRSNSCISNHMQCNRNTAEHASERELLCTATACGSRRRAQRSRRCHGRILLGNRIPGLGGRGWPGVGARGGGGRGGRVQNRLQQVEEKEREKVQIGLHCRRNVWSLQATSSTAAKHAGPTSAAAHPATAK